MAGLFSCQSYTRRKPVEVTNVPYGDISHLCTMRCATFAEGRRRLGWAQRHQAAILQQLTWGRLWYSPHGNTIWNTATQHQQRASVMEHKSMVDDVSIHSWPSQRRECVALYWSLLELLPLFTVQVWRIELWYWNTIEICTCKEV